MITCISLYNEPVEVPDDRVLFRPGAYALVLEDRKLLVTRMRHTGKLAIPGGGLEIHERLEEALVREVREETGLQAQVIRQVGFKEHFFYYNPTQEAFHGLLFFYAARITGGHLAAEGEVDDGEVFGPHWVEVDTLSADDFSHHGAEIVQMVSGLVES